MRCIKKISLLISTTLIATYFSCNVLAADKKIKVYSPAVSVYLSPPGNCTGAIIAEINNAKKHVKIQAYSFTHADIAKSLIDANKRGVDVEAVLDKSNITNKYSAATFLSNVGIPTYIDDKHAIAHNKVIIVDNEVVITGSFNFSKAAEEKNAENLLILKDPELAKEYINNYELHRRHSTLYKGKNNWLK